MSVPRSRAVGLDEGSSLHPMAVQRAELGWEQAPTWDGIGGFPWVYLPLGMCFLLSSLGIAPMGAVRAPQPERLSPPHLQLRQCQRPPVTWRSSSAPMAAVSWTSITAMVMTTAETGQTSPTAVSAPVAGEQGGERRPQLRGGLPSLPDPPWAEVEEPTCWG